MDKICSACKIKKPIEQFYRFKNKKLDIFEYGNCCRECQIIKSREFYKKNILKERLRNSKYTKTDIGRINAIKKTSKRNKKYPEKCRAENIVRYAIYTGKLIRKPCEVCGETKVHAHHPDYSKPLEVKWLCPKHHRMIHNTEKYLLNNL